MKRLSRMLSLMIAGLSLLALAAQAEDKVLNIYNWPDAVSPEVIAAFEQQFGAKVMYDAYDNPETMVAKLQSGASGYDVVFVDDYVLPLLVNSDVLAEMDHRQLPNIANIDPRFLNPACDPKNQYALPYMFVIFGMLYRTDAFAKPVDSWGAAFDPQLAGRIVVFDAMQFALSSTLKYLGYSVNSVNPNELQAAKALLLKQKPLVKAYTVFSMSQLEFLLTSGEADLIYPNTAGISLYLKQKTGGNPKLEFVVPQEGAGMSVVRMSIPKQAPHSELAHQFINFLHDPQINALNHREAYMELSVNAAAVPYLNPAVKEMHETYLKSESFAKFESLQDLGEGLSLWEDIWSEIKAQ